MTSLIKRQRKRKIGSTRQESGIKLKDIPDRIKYVKALLKDYSKQPQDTRHGGIISPSSATSKIPNDFVWCRISHYNVKITCHRHSREFACWKWTDDLVNPVSGHNPTVVYDIFGNMFITQRIYLCTHGCSSDKERALSVDILNSLPQVTRNALPIILSRAHVLVWNHSFPPVSNA